MCTHYILFLWYTSLPLDSYVRNIEKNEWWKMDDSRVSVVSTQEVLSSEAYMLFYRVVDHPYSKKLASHVKALNESYKEAAAKLKREKSASSIRNRASGSSQFTSAPSSPAVATIEENSDDETRLSSTSDRSVISGDAIRSRRKRKSPEYTSIEEWARSMTILTEKNIAKFREAERKVSKHIKFTPEFLKILSERAYKTNGKGSYGGINSLDSCGSGCQEDINIALLRCFLEVSKNDGIVDFTQSPTPKMTTRSSAASRGKSQSSIPVVDPTDDIL